MISITLVKPFSFEYSLRDIINFLIYDIAGESSSSKFSSMYTLPGFYIPLLYMNPPFLTRKSSTILDTFFQSSSFSFSIAVLYSSKPSPCGLLHIYLSHT